MFETDHIIGNVDFANPFNVRGWVLDKNTGQFPEDFLLVLPDGRSLTINPENSFVRTDVCESFDLSEETKSGFQINLYDAGNQRLPDYGLAHGQELLWTFSSFVMKLNESKCDSSKYPRYLGRKQVFIFYSRGSNIDRYLSSLINWQPNVFVKEMSSGISFYAIDLKSSAEAKWKKENPAPIVLFADAEAQEVYRKFPDLMEISRKICLGDNIRLDDGFGGLLNVLSYLSAIEEGDGVNAFTFFNLISSIVGYSDLYFGDVWDLFSYQSGSVPNFAKSLLREKLQGVEASDLILFSKKKIVRMSDVDPDDCAVFVNVKSLSTLMDIVPLGTKDFIKRALTRGAVMKIFSEGDGA